MESAMSKTEIVVGLLVGAIFTSMAVISVLPKAREYTFCPQPDITAYELARIYNNTNRPKLIAEHPDLRRHICEVK